MGPVRLFYPQHRWRHCTKFLTHAFGVLLTSTVGANLNTTRGGATNQTEDVTYRAWRGTECDVISSQRDDKYIISGDMILNKDILRKKSTARSGTNSGLFNGTIQDSHVTVLLVIL